MTGGAAAQRFHDRIMMMMSRHSLHPSGDRLDSHSCLIRQKKKLGSMSWERSWVMLHLAMMIVAQGTYHQTKAYAFVHSNDRRTAATAAAANATTTTSTLRDDFVFTVELLQLFRIGTILGITSRTSNPPPPTDYAIEDNMYEYYEAGRDAAIVAKTAGHCFAAFRSTVTDVPGDSFTNIEPGQDIVCSSDNSTCCLARRGFWQSYYADYQEPLERAIRNCAATCIDPTSCVILSGSSQGAGIAGAGAIALADLHPRVLVTGQPRTLYDPCPLGAGSNPGKHARQPTNAISANNFWTQNEGPNLLLTDATTSTDPSSDSFIDTSKWYRIINSAVINDSNNSSDNSTAEGNREMRLVYDAVPFLWAYGAQQFGNMILVSEDPSRVAYIGLDARDVFTPWDLSGQTHVESSYLRRIDALLEYAYEHASVSNKTLLSTTAAAAATTLLSNYSNVIIPSDGYSDGYYCTRDVECASKHCRQLPQPLRGSTCTPK